MIFFTVGAVTDSNADGMEEVLLERESEAVSGETGLDDAQADRAFSSEFFALAFIFVFT